MPNDDTTPTELNEESIGKAIDEMLDREDVVNGILNVFPFDKVHTSMMATEHEWTTLTDYASTSEKGANVKTAIPTVEKIREVGKEILSQLINDITGISMVGEGGLEAYKYRDSIGLRFVVADLECTWEPVDNG